MTRLLAFCASALLLLGCSGVHQPVENHANPCNPCTGEGQANPCAAAGTGNPCASTGTDADKQAAREAAASSGPIGGEATKTGTTPSESKLTSDDKFDINAVLKANRGDLTACFDEALATVVLPDEGFLIKAKFTIEADGSVAGAEVVEATERFGQAEECFLLRLAQIKFPTPPEGRVIETTYPFKIKRVLK